MQSEAVALLGLQLIFSIYTT